MLLTITPQLWDSQQLHICAATLNCNDTHILEQIPLPDRQQVLRQALCGIEANMITAKIDHNSPGLLTAILSVGGFYIGTECIFVHTKKLMVDENPETEVQFTRQCDSQPFLELAEDIHHSRFAMDPRLHPQTVKQLWRTSIANHCEGLAQEIAILYVKGKPAGLAVLGIVGPENSVQLKIVGILRAYRGQGLGRALLTPIILRYGLRSPLSVEAYATNTAALRLYQGCGFQLSSIRHVVHWWQQEVPLKTPTSTAKEWEPCKTL
jgi:ribosomal protein S18 acetylase RimI-like enzyme